jgi:WD40 repeat protein
MVPSSVAIWSRNDARVATVDGTITRVWDAASGAQLFKLGFRSSQNANDPNQQINTDAVGSPEWSNDGTKLLVVRMAGTNSNVSGMAQIHDAANGNRLVQIFPTNAPDPLANIAHWSPDNTKILLAGTNLEIHNATSGALIRKIDLNNDINSAEWSPNGAQIVTATQAAKFQVWDAATGALIRTLEQPAVSTSQDYKAAFSPNGGKIMTVIGSKVKIWDAASGTLLQTFDHGSPVRIARWRPSSDGVLTIEITGGKARAWRVG